jgi:metal-responsive CopG/Arc/MetJ family transcriptional regulator
MPKKVLVALPAKLLEMIDYIAVAECRNRSDLIREALRRYVDNFNRSHAELKPRLPFAKVADNGELDDLELEKII